MNNDKKAIKSGFWYTLSNFLIRSISIITTPIFTRVMSKSDFGFFNNYTSWVGIMVYFVTLNLETTLISAKYDFKEKFDNYILSMIALGGVTSIGWIILVNVVSQPFEQLFGMPRVHTNIMLIYLLFIPAIHLYQARERYNFEYKKTVVVTVALTVITTILSLILVLCMGNKLNGRIIGAAIPSIGFGLFFVLYFFRVGGDLTAKYWPYALRICLPYIPHTLSLTVLNSTDRVMINKFCGPESTAIYSLAYNCGAIVTMLVGSINNAYGPWLGEKLAYKRYDEIRRVSKRYILLFCFFALGIMLVAPEILLVLGGNAYTEAKFVIIPIAVGCVCQFMYTMFVNVEQFCKKTIGMATATVIAASINLVLNYLFIPVIGYKAAAYTTLIGYFCLLLMHMYLVKCIGFMQVYSYKFVLLVIIAEFILIYVLNILYKYNAVRYALVGVYLLTTFLLGIKWKENIVAWLKNDNCQSD